MPHERGPLPVPPSEFCITTLADPKARFCCSLANPSTSGLSRHPAISLGQPVDTQALNIRAKPAARVLVSATAHERLVPLRLCSRRVVRLRSILKKIGMSRKDAQWLS